MGLKGKFDKFFSEAGKYNVRNSTWGKFWLFTDYFLENKLHKVPMEEYFKYDFYLKNRAGRDSFCTRPKRAKFYDYFNDKEERKWLDNKALFDEKFKALLGRDKINLRNSSEEEFSCFLSQYSKIFIKPIEGRYGIGAGVIEIDENTNVSEILNHYLGQDIIAEEYIQQAPELAKLNDSSVNSIRVMTFLNKDGTAEIVPYAALRIGREGKTVDNFHNDGITATVDAKTGYVMTAGLDRNGNRWVTHPDSEEPIVGYCIPYWGSICECVRKAALLCPKVRFIGWDVSVTNQGKVILIEGNSRPDPDVIQAIDGRGKWYLYDEYIKKEEA